jgi:hypothetical protein
LSTGQSTAAANGNGRSLAAADLVAREQMPRLITRLETTISLLGLMIEEVGEIELDLARRRESKRLRDSRYRQRRRNRRKHEVTHG